MMAAVKGKDTKPEMYVRRCLFAKGFRFRLHPANLPGRPDIVLPRFRMAVLVNGCFWHGHSCPRGRRPSSNADFWNSKIDANIARDRRNVALLRDAGWRVMVIWECTAKRAADILLRRLLVWRRLQDARRASTERAR